MEEESKVCFNCKWLRKVYCATDDCESGWCMNTANKNDYIEEGLIVNTTIVTCDNFKRKTKKGVNK